MDIDEDPPTRHRPRTRDVSSTTTYILDHQHAKVRGTILRLADVGERIAVACPFCYRVHLHEPTRHPVSTFVPPGVDPAAAEVYDESTGYEGEEEARPLRLEAIEVSPAWEALPQSGGGKPPCAWAAQPLRVPDERNNHFFVRGMEEFLFDI